MAGMGWVCEGSSHLMLSPASKSPLLAPWSGAGPTAPGRAWQGAPSPSASASFGLKRMVTLATRLAVNIYSLETY